jgi:hypothetical protein
MSSAVRFDNRYLFPKSHMAFTEAFFLIDFCDFPCGIYVNLFIYANVLWDLRKRNLRPVGFK